jgi:hypothetical protein
MRGAKGCESRVFLERRLGGLDKSTADALTAVAGRFIGAVPEFSYNVWTTDLLVGLLQLPRGLGNCSESLMREWLRALLRSLKNNCRCGLRLYHGAYVTYFFKFEFGVARGTARFQFPVSHLELGDRAPSCRA